MPDWSYHPLKKILLNHMRTSSSRTFIHRALNTISSLPGGSLLIHFLGHMKPPKPMQQEICHIKFRSPIGLSSIIDPSATAIHAFPELGFGFLEIGPITLQTPTQHLSPIQDQTQIHFPENREKLSLKHALVKLQQFKHQTPIFVQLDHEASFDELKTMVSACIPYVDAFILTSKQVELLRDVNLMRPIFLLLEITQEEQLRLMMEQWQLDGILLQTPRNHTITEYYSESADAAIYLSKLAKKLKQLFPTLTIITSGGVEHPEDAILLKQAGADLIQLTSGYVKAGPGLPKRIHERMLFDATKRNGESNVFQYIWSLLFGLVILIGGMIALFFSISFVILPYDEAFIGLTKSELLQLNPKIIAFMAHDRMALAGTMLSGGILYIQLARHGLRQGIHWTKLAFHTAAIIGFLGILLFIGYGYFDWLHGLFWLILLPIYFLSYKEGKAAIYSPAAYHTYNDKAWRLANYGQLMFVILGFSLVIGGVVISTIGVTDVFITTDIEYICMPPEVLHEFSASLIPVIAHDRTGFGSALLSVGILVLSIALWGFQKGQRWVWNTLALGALPAFIAGIGTHFYIGYTSFIHLLPVYFLVLLYILGLALSRPYLTSGHK